MIIKRKSKTFFVHISNSLCWSHWAGSDHDPISLHVATLSVSTKGSVQEYVTTSPGYNGKAYDDVEPVGLGGGSGHSTKINVFLLNVVLYRSILNHIFLPHFGKLLLWVDKLQKAATPEILQLDVLAELILSSPLQIYAKESPTSHGLSLALMVAYDTGSGMGQTVKASK